MQQDLVLSGELDHPARHRQVGVGAEEMELADRDVAVLPQPLLDVGHDGLVAHPGPDLAALPVRPQLRQDEVRRLGVEPLGALVVRARHHPPPHAGLAQERDRLLRWELLPGVVAVVQMGVEDRQVGGAGASRAAGEQQGENDVAHGLPHGGGGLSRIAQASARPNSRSRSSRRRSLPLAVLGSSATNSIRRGYL